MASQTGFDCRPWRQGPLVYGAQRRIFLKFAAEGPVSISSIPITPASPAPSIPACTGNSPWPGNHTRPGGQPTQGHMQRPWLARLGHNTQPTTTPIHHRAAVPGTTACTGWPTGQFVYQHCNAHSSRSAAPNPNVSRILTKWEGGFESFELSVSKSKGQTRWHLIKHNRT